MLIDQLLDIVQLLTHGRRAYLLVVIDGNADRLLYGPGQAAALSIR
jgi:hypothetical protein